MRIEEAVTERALHPRSGQKVFAAERVVHADERTLDVSAAASRTLCLSVERVLHVLRGLELVLVPFDRFEHELGIHLFERHDLNVAAQG